MTTTKNIEAVLEAKARARITEEFRNAHHTLQNDVTLLDSTVFKPEDLFFPSDRGEAVSFTTIWLRMETIYREKWLEIRTNAERDKFVRAAEQLIRMDEYSAFVQQQQEEHERARAGVAEVLGFEEPVADPADRASRRW